MILHTSEQLEVLMHHGTSDFVVITFAPKNDLADGKTFWAQKVAQKAGITMIGVMPRGPHWYPMSAMKAAQQAILQAADKFKARITYGQSMGAYAALKYSHLLRATHVLSFSPQFSIDPADLDGRDDRFVHSFRPQAHAGMAIGRQDVAGKAYVVLDPYYEADRFNAALIKRQVPDLTEIHFPRTDHFPVLLFGGTDRAKSLFSACLTGGAEDILALGRSVRRAAPIRITTVCKAYARKSVARARWLYGRRSETFDRAEVGAFHQKAGLIAMAQGKSDEALDALAYSLAFDPENGLTARYLSDLQMKRRDYWAAANWAARAASLQPNNPNLQTRIGDAFVRLGRTAEAENAFRAALRINGAYARAMQSLVKLYLSQQRIAEALVWAEKVVRLDPGSAAAQAALSSVHLAMAREAQSRNSVPA